MNDTSNLNAEQIVEKTQVRYQFDTSKDRAKEIVAALRSYGLLVSDDLRGAAFLEAAMIERKSHAKRGWPIEHDRRHGVGHLLSLALNYAANGKHVKAASLVVAARELLDNTTRQEGDVRERLAKLLDPLLDRAMGDYGSGEDVQDEMLEAIFAAFPVLSRNIASEIEADKHPVVDERVEYFNAGLDRAAEIVRNGR